MTRNIILLLAVLLLLACQERKTDRAEEFREAIHQKDSTELAQAQAELTKLDSIITFSTLNVEDEKRHFVFEKQEKYQTMGYWVLPAYKGSKERFTFFPEVEESGKMLLVNIDGKRRYTFTEVNLDSSDYQSLLPTGLSARQRDDVHRCFTFAKAMHDLDIARKTREKTLTKIRFFERKMKK
ncbi:MAG: hypothetical protein Q4D25_08435 [Bacteroidales bacterium]|jgi:hypothetical protein|nr:hypothetical protein [Bacteroidales bacterium]